MLRFFRIIRKKLIEEDNIRNYLLYAIGEILLVVTDKRIMAQLLKFLHKESFFIETGNMELNLFELSRKPIFLINDIAV